MGHGDYRKWNDRQMNSSTYHKKDGTNIRAKLKEELMKSMTELRRKKIEEYTPGELDWMIKKVGDAIKTISVPSIRQALTEDLEGMEEIKESRQVKLNTLTVGELRGLLSKYDDDTPIAPIYTSGDHWRTQLLSGINFIDEREIVWSEYHRNFKIADGESDEDSRQTILVLE